MVDRRDCHFGRMAATRHAMTQGTSWLAATTGSYEWLPACEVDIISCGACLSLCCPCAASLSRSRGAGTGVRQPGGVTPRTWRFRVKGPRANSLRRTHRGTYPCLGRVCECRELEIERKTPGPAQPYSPDVPTRHAMHYCHLPDQPRLHCHRSERNAWF